MISASRRVVGHFIHTTRLHQTGRGGFFVEFESIRATAMLRAGFRVGVRPVRLEYLGRLVSVSICPAARLTLIIEESIKDKVKRLKVTGRRVVLSLERSTRRGVPRYSLEALLDRSRCEASRF